jgi:hypothetical protein
MDRLSYTPNRLSVLGNESRTKVSVAMVVVLVVYSCRSARAAEPAEWFFVVGDDLQ